jgi:hypothetical protein
MSGRFEMNSRDDEHFEEKQPCLTNLRKAIKTFSTTIPPRGPADSVIARAG